MFNISIHFDVNLIVPVLFLHGEPPDDSFNHEPEPENVQNVEAAQEPEEDLHYALRTIKVLTTFLYTRWPVACDWTHISLIR